MAGLPAFSTLVLRIDEIEGATGGLARDRPRFGSAHQRVHDEFARAARVGDEAPAMQARSHSYQEAPATSAPGCPGPRATMTEIAELAVGVGLPVFPCQADKRPACPHGFKDAAIAAEAVRALWRRFPGPLIGVPTGAASGLFVLDIDPNGIDWLDMVCRDGRLSATRAHRTRRDGFHLVYRVPKQPLPNSASKLARGVDTRGEGGYVIWPPSEGYEVVNPSPVATLPRWLEQRLRAPRQAGPAPETAATYAGADRGNRRGEALELFVAQSREGERNQRLFWAVCRAAETGDRQLGCRLIAAARACGLGEIEARRTVESAFKTVGQRSAA